MSEEDKREAWHQLKIWRLGSNWVHSQTGRVFIGGTPKGNWCEEMSDRYGEFGTDDT